MPPLTPELIRRADAAYPSRLLCLDVAPELLWLRGRWDTRLPAVAVVGARLGSMAGKSRSFALGRDLASAGVAVVSGGAVGIDAAAHRGALSASGRTLVVLGTGADVVYPRSHRDLYDQVERAGGGLLSMFPPGTPPKPWHFPVRNQLIAAMSDVIVVVEAELGSGSRITALAGQRLGRVVACVPGSPGADELLRRGAYPIEGAADLLPLLGAVRTQQPLPPPELSLFPRPAAPEHFFDQAQQVRGALSGTPRDIGELAALTGLSAAACAQAIVDLELSGLCARLIGGRYVAMEHTT